MEPDDYPQRVIEAVRTGEVVSLFFPRLGCSLILDWRRGHEEGPAALLDGLVASPSERLASFERLRPGLPLPDRLTLVPWTAALRAFVETGVLEAVVQRCRLDGGEAMARTVQEHFRELERRERRTLRDLVRGVGMRTIWERPAED
jgi:hypothetical protein